MGACAFVIHEQNRERVVDSRASELTNVLDVGEDTVGSTEESEGLVDEMGAKIKNLACSWFGFVFPCTFERCAISIHPVPHKTRLE